MTEYTQRAPLALLEHATATVLTGESLSELVDQLVDGHHNARDGGEQLALRADALASSANRLQALVLATVGAAAEGLSEDALTVLLHDRGAETVVFGSWESDVPLFLLATSYAPYTSVPAPNGAGIVWLNPHTERTFLESLAAAGAVDLFSLDPILAGD